MVVARSATELATTDEAGMLALLGELNRQVADRHARHWNAQTRAWEEELRLVRLAAESLDAAGLGDALLVFEYEIPRRQRRPDVVVVTPTALVVLEFKVGASEYDATARWQAAEYALDLRDFHSESAEKGLAGVVVATAAPGNLNPALDERGIPIFLANATNLPEVLERAIRRAEATVASPTPRPPAQWLLGRYRPTPTIIEAAEMLYKGHGVADINHAYAQNLTETTAALVETIERAARDGERVICFVTGVPGAGKTLTGLDAVHDPKLRGEGRPAGVFLSGNGPLVKVIQESLVRSGKHANRKEARRTVTTFVQNVHRFVQEYASDPELKPPEHVVVFDEAQRAWSRAKMEKERRGSFSEAEQMLEIMERFDDWAVLIALVGGGQEIHDGEAGLAAWGEALTLPNRKPWRISVSPEALGGGASVSGHRLFEGLAPPALEITPEPKLHLRVSVRAPRAQVLSEWVDAVLRGDPSRAAELAKRIHEFPIVATRDLDVAKDWLRQRGSDGQRVGLVASAGARRLRAYGVQLSTQNGQNSDIDQWFLASHDDIRSSSFLEVAATEFECQGLELDYVGMCWGDDLTRVAEEWSYRRFRGSSWSQVHKQIDRAYMLNKYRVLLTRARKGLIIWVPAGSASDPTRDPERLNETWGYLTTCGVTPVSSSRHSFRETSAAASNSSG